MNNCSAVPSVCTPQHLCECYPLVRVLFHPPLPSTGGLSPNPFLWLGSCLIYGHCCSAGLVILHLTTGAFTMLYWRELFLPGATFPWCSWALISLLCSFYLVADSRDNTMYELYTILCMNCILYYSILCIEYDPERSSSLFIYKPVVLTFEVIKLLCWTSDLREAFWGEKIHMGMF